MKPLVAKKNSN